MTPPLPSAFALLERPSEEEEALSGMLMSYFMNGYHTGYYQVRLSEVHQLQLTGRASRGHRLDGYSII